MRWTGRSPGRRVRLTELGAVTHWLSQRGPAHGDEHRVDPDAARRVLRRSSVDPRELHSFLADTTLGIVRASTPEELSVALEDALWRGELCVIAGVREARPQLPEFPVAPEHTPHTPSPQPPAPAPHAPAALELTVLDSARCPIPALPLTLDDAGAKQYARASDAAGHGRFLLQSPGACTLRLAAYHAPAWPSPTHVPTPLPEGVTVLEAYLSLLTDESPSWTLEAETHTFVVLERPTTWWPTPNPLRFDHDSAVPVPGPWTGGLHPLAPLVHSLLALLEHPERALFMVGRASTPGKQAHNQSLSEARAAVLGALIDNDRDIWVALAQEHSSGRDTIAYFDYLGRERGWSCACETPIEALSGKANADTRACVRAFQSEYNQRFEGKLALDAVCGRKTLRAMFEVLRDELERWLTKLGVEAEQLAALRSRMRTGGCGARLAGQHGEGPDSERLDRSVDLIGYEGQDDFQVIPLERLYTSELPRRLPLPLPHEPDAWATGPFTIVSDLTEHESFAPETYRLTSEDGRVFDERCIPDDAHIEAGEYVLHYAALPTDARYTLVVVAANEYESMIFTDLAYGQLHPRGPTA